MIVIGSCLVVTVKDTVLLPRRSWKSVLDLTGGLGDLTSGSFRGAPEVEEEGKRVISPTTLPRREDLVLDLEVMRAVARTGAVSEETGRAPE